MSVALFGGIKFFAVATALSLPAVALGVMEKRIKYYGLAASAVMTCLAVGFQPVSLIQLAIYIMYQIALIKLVLYFKISGEQRGLVRLLILLSILPLVISKATGMLCSADIFGIIGLSYMTFKSVQVLIEVCDGIITELRVVDYLCFILFFPTLLCGPIDRSRRFLADADRSLDRAEYLGLLGDGIMEIFMGIVFKFVLAALCTRAGLIHMYVYAAYLYFDFAGYSMMAIGFGKVFGVNTPQNFNCPWMSVDIKDFWNRWHITLSTWLRDFLFSRLLMSAMREKWFRSNRIAQTCVCLVINMLVMGLWHGLEGHYILYGLYHGILLAATEVYQKKSKFYKRNKKNKLYRFVSWFVTFNAVVFGFYIFSGNMIV